MTYKGYQASVIFDEDARLFHGEVVNTRDVITFQGSSVDELDQALRDSVDDYLDFCASRNEDPDKPFSGEFTVHISPELHRRIALAASRRRMTVDAYVARKLAYPN